MGCGIHAVLQKRNTKSGKWETIIKDALYFPSSLAREFNSVTEEFRWEGVPEDASVSYITDRGYYLTDSKMDKFYLGEHSLGYFSLASFVDYKVKKPESVSFTREPETGTLHIEVGGIDEWSVCPSIEALQTALLILFSAEDLADVRFIVGYDS